MVTDCFSGNSKTQNDLVNFTLAYSVFAWKKVSQVEGPSIFHVTILQGGGVND